VVDVVVEVAVVGEPDVVVVRAVEVVAAVVGGSAVVVESPLEDEDEQAPSNRSAATATPASLGDLAGPPSPTCCVRGLTGLPPFAW
jgi:hypothetical protein